MNEKVSFQVGNICEDNLPTGDLLIVRDCLFHLSHSDINRFLINILNLDYKFLLTSSFEFNDDFENIYKGQVSKSGIAVLPSKRTRRTPDQKTTSNLAKEALKELKAEQPEVKQENLDQEEPLELKEEIENTEEK